MKLDETQWLPIAVGAVVVDVVFLMLNYARIVFVSDELTRWYTQLGPSAMAMDILVIAMAVAAGVALARRGKDEASWGRAALAVVLVQCVHDVLFYAAFQSTPRGAVHIFDVFKDYAAEVGVHALWSDALMVLGTLCVAEGVAHTPSHVQTACLLASVYVGLFALHAKPRT